MSSNSYTEDILRPLTEDELNYLENLYKLNYPNAICHYFSLNNQIKWNKKLKEPLNFHHVIPTNWDALGKDFYTHRNGILKKNGTYVSINKDYWKSIVSFHTLESSFEEIKECLETTNRIDWASGPTIASINMELVPLVKSIAEKRGAILKCEIECWFFSMKNELARSIDNAQIPDGYEVREISAENAEQVHREWPLNYESSVDFIRGMILLNQSVGIFRKRDNVLVGCALQNEFGGLGVLQVTPSERCKGFGTTLAMELTRKISESDKNLDVNAFTIKKNEKPQALLRKIGYEKVCPIMWFEYKKTIDTE